MIIHIGKITKKKLRKITWSITYKLNQILKGIKTYFQQFVSFVKFDRQGKLVHDCMAPQEKEVAIDILIFIINIVGKIFWQEKSITFYLEGLTIKKGKWAWQKDAEKATGDSAKGKGFLKLKGHL